MKSTFMTEYVHFISEHIPLVAQDTITQAEGLSYIV